MWAQIVSEIFAGIGRYKASQARMKELRRKQSMSEYNAKLARLDAKAAQRKTDFGQTMQAREAASIMGSMEAGMGASGGQLNFAVLSSQWDELQLDNFLIGLEGRTAKTRFESEAKLHDMQAKLYDEAVDAAWWSYHMGEGQKGFGMAAKFKGMGGGGETSGGDTSSPDYQGYRGAGAGGTYTDNTSGYGMGYGGYPGSYGGNRRKPVAILGN